MSDEVSFDFSHHLSLATINDYLRIFGFLLCFGAFNLNFVARLLSLCNSHVSTCKWVDIARSRNAREKLFSVACKLKLSFDFLDN